MNVVPLSRDSKADVSSDTSFMLKSIKISLPLTNKLSRVLLKEHCHDDFAVLGQLCAKMITFNHKQNASV